MKITITTTYENVSQEWYDWWVKRLLTQAPMPGAREAGALLWAGKNEATFESVDPDDVKGTTVYKVERDN